MKLSKHDIQQLDAAYIKAMPEGALRVLMTKLMGDLKEPHDQLNQDPLSSSRSQSSRAPWAGEQPVNEDVARMLLNDWDTFWVVFGYPWLPLTNKDAERALRHWVIARRISYDTRTARAALHCSPALSTPAASATPAHRRTSPRYYINVAKVLPLRCSRNPRHNRIIGKEGSERLRVGCRTGRTPHF